METEEKQTILVVDDTPENIDVLVGILRDQYKVRAASHADQAFKAIAKKVPDLVLLDIMMPEIDGYEVCKRLKADPTTADLPVIFLTAKTAVEDEIKGFDLGAVDYITKPISPPVVLARVATHLSLKSARESLETKNKQLKKTLSNLKAAQDQLVLSEKMAALGQLVAGVAHEINTPLGAIKSSAESVATSLETTIQTMQGNGGEALEEADFKLLWNLLGQLDATAPPLAPREKRKAAKDLMEKLQAEGFDIGQTEVKQLISLGIREISDSISTLLNSPRQSGILTLANHFNNIRMGIRTIGTAGNKASKIVFSLKSYSHFGNTDEKLAADIRTGVETVLTLYENQMKHAINLVTEFDEIPQIMCYPDELDQVWTNLIHNSLQAMNNSGDLTVRVKAEDGNIVVSISDNGPGIPEEIQAKIFDPFFTTKPPGEGSGLGLDIVKRIVEKHGGKMEYQTAAGEGTTFFITIPVETTPA